VTVKQERCDASSITRDTAKPLQSSDRTGSLPPKKRQSSFALFPSCSKSICKRPVCAAQLQQTKSKK
jgi:hypothetical protein